MNYTFREKENSVSHNPTSSTLDQTLKMLGIVRQRRPEQKNKRLNKKRFYTPPTPRFNSWEIAKTTQLSLQETILRANVIIPLKRSLHWNNSFSCAIGWEIWIFFSVNNKHLIILSTVYKIRPYSSFLSLRHFTVINKSFYFQKLSSTSQNNQHYRCGS